MADDDADFLSRRLRWGARPDRPAAPRQSIEGRTTEVRVAPARVTTVPSFERRDLDRIDEEARDRRRQLWRDTAMLLSGIVAALLVANLVIPELTGFAGASPSP